MNRLLKKSFKISLLLLVILLAFPVITFFLGRRSVLEENRIINPPSQDNSLKVQTRGLFELDGYSFNIPAMFKACKWKKGSVIVPVNDSVYCAKTKLGTDALPKIVINTIEGNLATKAFSNLKDTDLRGLKTIKNITAGSESGIEVLIDRSNEQDQGPRYMRIVRVAHHGITYELVQNDHSQEVKNAFDSILANFSFVN